MGQSIQAGFEAVNLCNIPGTTEEIASLYKQYLAQPRTVSKFVLTQLHSF
jgi:hypothetical protein